MLGKAFEQSESNLIRINLSARCGGQSLNLDSVQNWFCRWYIDLISLLRTIFHLSPFSLQTVQLVEGIVPRHNLQ